MRKRLAKKVTVGYSSQAEGNHCFYFAVKEQRQMEAVRTVVKGTSKMVHLRGKKFSLTDHGNSVE